MLHLVKPGTNFDFLGKTRLFLMISVASFVVALLILAARGINFGLDFSGGHEILLQFDPEKNVDSREVRKKLEELFPTVDTTVQSYQVPTSSAAFFLTRIERSQTFGDAEIADMEKAFQAKYQEHFARLRYNPDSGDVVEVEFVENATTAMGRPIDPNDLAAVVETTNHPVRLVREIGRGDIPRFSIVLRGVDTSMVNAMKDLDPSVQAASVEFVGPTVGKQLRDDGILAVGAALLWMLIYIAFRFDFYFAPGAVVCLFHDAILTVGILALLGEEFSLTTIAALLTLVGYSINDTIVVFDRIREVVGKTQGSALYELVNKAMNEMLNRTLMTSLTVLFCCVCLMAFGRGTVLFPFGLIMFVGIILGTYSSIYVASPIYIYLKDRFAPKVVSQGRETRTKAEVEI